MVFADARGWKATGPTHQQTKGANGATAQAEASELAYGGLGQMAANGPKPHPDSRQHRAGSHRMRT